jgi:transposase
VGGKSNFHSDLKIIIVESYLFGKESRSEIIQKYSIPEATLRRWIMLYQSSGPEGLVNKFKRQNYSKELKTQAVNDYLSRSLSLSGICKKYHIPSDSIVRRWIKKYNGHEGIKSSNIGGKIYMTKGRSTTFEERVEIVHFCIENNNDYPMTIEKYQASYYQIYTWIQKYKKNGLDGLFDRRGKRKEVNSMTEFERLEAERKLLQAENRRLQMEISFLKKLDEVERRREIAGRAKKTNI